MFQTRSTAVPSLLFLVLKFLSHLQKSYLCWTRVATGHARGPASPPEAPVCAEPRLPALCPPAEAHGNGGLNVDSQPLGMSYVQTCL